MATHSLDDAWRYDRTLLMATRAIVFGTPTEVLQETNLKNAFSGQADRLSDSSFAADNFRHAR